MRLALKDVQESALEQLLRRARAAQVEVDAGGDPQALILAAPTGSGKTVVASAFIEALLCGTDGEDNPEARFLWLSDQPELNEQSRRKILETSSAFSASDLVTIDSSFDQEFLDAGKVHFLNIQKIGRDRRLVAYGDARRYTIWDTIKRTIEEFADSFWLIVDEAHRGMLRTAADERAAATIVQKFIVGDQDIPPSPLILAISATPERFLDRIAATPRVPRKVVINPEDVRASGLLKDVVTLHHPDEALPADVTLLRAACEQLQRYWVEWESYCETEHQPGVRPLLVVQVEDAQRTRVTRTDLGEALTAIQDVLGPLGERGVAHCFQEGQSLDVEGRALRYVAPVDIHADIGLRVIFFKLSLNTGWDCPRAEVMMSFRRAVDYTSIAQLVGRMVRSPLARRVERNEFLNSVSLYLPHFNRQAITRVVGYLTSPDPDQQLAVDVQVASETIELHRDSERENLVPVIERLPSYSVHRVNRWPHRRRLMRLARLLAIDEIDLGCVDTATDLILESLLEDFEELSAQHDFRGILTETAEVDIRAVDLLYGTDEVREAALASIPLVKKNIDDLFSSAGRRLGEGLHLTFVKRRVKASDDPVARIKIELFVLLQQESVLRDLENQCAAEVRDLFARHRAEIRKVPADRRDQYRQIHRTSVDPEPEEISLPDVIQLRKGDGDYARHLYSDDEGKYVEKLNTWERQVIESELENTAVVGWLRNPARKDWSLCIPYELGGEDKPLYPDFIILREEEDSLVADLLDPHSPGLGDAWAKAAGLAKYAASHGEDYGRIESIMVDRGAIRRLDLLDEGTRTAVRNVTNNEQLKALYRQSS